MHAQDALPRWRGFNLLEGFSTQSTGDFVEDDFRFISDWGFNFVRLPLCYTLWAPPCDGDGGSGGGGGRKHGGEGGGGRESFLVKIDRAVELGRRYGLHVNLSLHRAPGYSVSGECQEPCNLWKDKVAQDQFCLQWYQFARRYRGIDSQQLSFNLVNEPPHPSFHAAGMTRQDHQHVIRAAVAAVQAVDPQRLIILDGVGHGAMPCPELADLSTPGERGGGALVGQSCRGYAPGGVSHYQAPWANGERFPLPEWPGGLDWDLETRWDRSSLEKFYEPWGKLAARGVGVHCGEAGAYNRTPHAVFLAWLRDVLEILTAMNIGVALWNFRGSFGVLDSERLDVAYEAYRGHLLDRKLLGLLQEFSGR